MTFSCLTFLFLVDLLMATQGGLHIYHLLITYIATWPSLLISLLTLTASLLCLGPHSILLTLVDMSKVRLPHVVISHLSVLYTTISPVLLQALGEGLREVAEVWSGLELEVRTVYGPRRYSRHSRLSLHVDRLSTHVISAIINIQQQVDTP